MYEIIFYDTTDDKCPVQDFLDSLEPKFLAKTLRTIDLLETTNGIIKKTAKTPKSAIDLAKKYKTDYEWRHRNEQL